jgi:hypothetical protein
MSQCADQREGAFLAIGSFYENPAPYGNLFNSDDYKAAMDEIARCLEGDTRRRVPARSPNFMAGDAE